MAPDMLARFSATTSAALRSRADSAARSTASVISGLIFLDPTSISDFGDALIFAPLHLDLDLYLDLAMEADKHLRGP